MISNIIYKCELLSICSKNTPVLSDSKPTSLYDCTGRRRLIMYVYLISKGKGLWKEVCLRLGSNSEGPGHCRMSQDDHQEYIAVRYGVSGCHIVFKSAGQFLLDVCTLNDQYN